VIQKNVCLLILGLLLPLLLLACMPEVQLEGASLENDSSAETAVPATAASSATATAVSEHPTLTPLSQPSEVPEHPEEPTPLPDEGSGLDSDPPPAGEPTGTPDEEPTLQPSLQIWVDLAKEDLAQRLDFPVDDIELLAFELKEWSDASFGCPQPGMSYAQVPQDGYLITLQAADQVYNYHGGGGGDLSPFLCQQTDPEISIPKQPPLNLKQTPTRSIPPPRD
jgi:hypothetical protein